MSKQLVETNSSQVNRAVGSYSTAVDKAIKNWSSRLPLEGSIVRAFGSTLGRFTITLGDLNAEQMDVLVQLIARNADDITGDIPF